MVIAMLAALVLLLASTPASAGMAGSTKARSLGIVPEEWVGVSAAAAAPPSPDHPWGTVMIGWCAEDASSSSAVHLGEWDLHEGRWLHDEVVRRPSSCPDAIHLARSAERLVVALGNSASTQLMVLERSSSASAFAETAAATFEDASAPSLDADDQIIALGTYGLRTPTVQMSPSSSVWPPEHALHVRLIEPSTLRIVSSRVFRGAHLLRRHAVARRAGEALRLLAGRLFVAVPDDEPRIVSLRLPSLATERERTFVVPSLLRTPNTSSIVLNRIGDSLLIGIEDTFVLSPGLEIVARHRPAITNPIAFDRASHRALATDGDPVTLDGYRVRVSSDDVFGANTVVLFAHGRGVVIDETHPIATIRVVP